MLAIAERLKEQLLKTGMSAYVLEKKAGLKHSAVQNIIYGRSKKPSVTLIQTIAQALNCTIEDLITTTEQVPDNPAINLPQNFNSTLFLRCTEIVDQEAKKQHIQLSKASLLTCIEAIYEYTIKSGKTVPDLNFTRWIIEKHHTHSL